MKRILPLFLVCLVFPLVAAADPMMLKSRSGDRSIVAEENGDVLYASSNGLLQMHVGKHGIEIGAFALHVTNVEREGDVVRMHVVVKNGEVVAEDDVVINQKTLSMDAANQVEVNRIFRDFVASSDGQLLLEAQALIRANELVDGTPREPHGPRRSIRSEWSWLGCGGQVLNAVAGGAAMVGGCTGGVACTACCVSGVAWYGSALMQIADSDACVFV